MGIILKALHFVYAKQMAKIQKNNLSLFCCMLFLSVSLIAQNKSTNIQTIDGKKYYIHKVEKSQSLYGISKMYGVNLEEIYTINPELKSGVKIHQEIKVPFIGSNSTILPSSAITAIDTGKYLIHKTLKGETIYSISKKYNLTEKQLVAYNPLIAEGVKENQQIIVGEKIKRKSQQKEIKENKPQQTVKEVRTVPLLADSSLLKPVSKPKKQNYNVALILPFKLDQTINTDVNELAKSNSNFPLVPGYAIDFYLGFKRAMDSLINKDFEINLQLYDVDDKDSLKLIEIVSSPKFKEVDFIFGPFYASGFKTISKKARELHIPIVSPITQQNKILYNNIYISKTNPSQFTLLESLADYCIDSLKQSNSHVIIASFEKDKKGNQFVNAFRKYYNEKQKSLGKSIKDTISLVKGIEGVKRSYVANAKNVVIILSNSQVEVVDFITQLAVFSDKKDVVLFGWQSISEMEVLDQAYLNNLSFTFPHQYNLTNVISYTPLIDSYRLQQETSSPSEYFFIGFDISFYYLKNLRELGPDFIHTLNTLPFETNYMRFKYARPDNITGYDNRGVYIFRYQDYKLVKTGWK